MMYYNGQANDLCRKPYLLPKKKVHPVPTKDNHAMCYDTIHVGSKLL